MNKICQYESSVFEESYLGIGSDILYRYKYRSILVMAKLSETDRTK